MVEKRRIQVTALMNCIFQISLNNLIEMPSQEESRHWPFCKVLKAQMILARDLQKIQRGSLQHKQNVKATAFSPRWMENKMHFQNVPHSLRLLYQREKSEICLLCGIIHQVLPWPTAGRTPAQTGHILEIADTWHSFPKYHTSLLTVSCPLAYVSHSLVPYSNLNPFPKEPSSTPPIAMQSISIISVAVHGGLFWIFFPLIFLAHLFYAGV